MIKCCGLTVLKFHLKDLSEIDRLCLPLPVPEPTHDLLVPLLARADEVVVVDAEEGGRGAVLGRDTVAKLPACS